MSDFRKYLLELEAFYKNQAQCKQSLGGATAALSDERISKLFGHLINEFDAANNRPQWISVEDRLPEFHKQILFYAGDIDGLMKGAFYRNSHKFQNNNGDFFYKKEVTHWMPLPTPPTQEQGE